jgi:hypothetical protein
MTDGRFGNLDLKPSDMIAIREREAREGTMSVEADTSNYLWKKDNAPKGA